MHCFPMQPTTCLSDSFHPIIPLRKPLRRFVTPSPYPDTMNPSYRIPSLHKLLFHPRACPTFKLRPSQSNIHSLPVPSVSVSPDFDYLMPPLREKRQRVSPYPPIDEWKVRSARAVILSLMDVVAIQRSSGCIE